MKNISGRKDIVSLGILLMLVVAAYVPHIHHFGFLQDDWNVLFTTEQIGPGSLIYFYSIDRPMQGYLALLEYKLIGTSMIGYQILALGFRFLDAVVFLLILNLVWPKKIWLNLVIAAFAITYPGFNEQPHAFNYQTQFASRLSLLLSIYLCLLPFYIKKTWIRLILIFISLALAQIGYGLLDYQIGLEALRIGFIAAIFFQRRKILKWWRLLLYEVLFLVGAGGFIFWRIFLFESRRASVNASSMLASYSQLGEKLLQDLRELGENLYRLLISAYYEPLRIFRIYMRASDLLIGILIGLAAAVVTTLVVNKFIQLVEQTDKKEIYRHSLELILIGFFGAVGALAPIIFGGRQINYTILGDRFSYPGSLSACLFVGGLIELFRSKWVRSFIIAVLVLVSVLTQYTNDVIFARNYEQTNATWWQMSWRAPQIKPGTLISGNIFLGMLDEDYTLWSPANLIYYPRNHAILVSAEVLNETTKPLFILQGTSIAERRGIDYTRNYGNLLLISKNENACLHIIDSDHPEFSQEDDPLILEIGGLSRIDQIDVNSTYQPSPRVDLFGPEPAHDWCYIYQKAQQARQVRDWEAVSKYGDQALLQNESPSDPMEWLIILQAFAYTHNVNYDSVLQAVNADSYTADQACSVFSNYSKEISQTNLADTHNRLLADVCN